MPMNQPYPLFEKISIECNSFCNRSCSFCTRTYDKREKTRMPTELVHKVLNELAQVDFKGLISFHFYNEVFTDNRIFSFYAKCKELGLRNYIFTNGDFLTLENIELLSNFNIDEFVVSLYDWSTEEEYEEKKNYFITEFKLDTYSWNLIFVKGGEDFGNRAGYVKHRVEDLSLPINASCSKIETKMDIRYDGTVVMCCLDYFGIHKIGNISTENVIDIWYSQLRKMQIEELRKGNRKKFKLCSGCSDYIIPVTDNEL
jgi:MoaA/NifB/PqqE/SkfB family radical SAM enzyme